MVAPLGPWQGWGAAVLTRFFPETWGSHTHTSHGWCPGNECHPWGGARLAWPRGFHGASGELWVATVCPDVGSLPGDPRVGRGAAPGTPPRFAPPTPDLSPALSHSQQLVSGSASPWRLLVLFGELSLAHTFSACTSLWPCSWALPPLCHRVEAPGHVGKSRISPKSGFLLSRSGSPTRVGFRGDGR